MSDDDLLTFLAPWCPASGQPDRREFIAALRATLELARATPAASVEELPPPDYYPQQCVASGVPVRGYYSSAAVRGILSAALASRAGQVERKPLTDAGVDCIGLALDLEQQSDRVQSQTAERAMLAAAHGLRLIAERAHGIAPKEQG